MRSLYLHLSMIYFLIVKGGKLRNWMGPTNFLGGPIPIQRQGHGLVSLYNSTLFLFAGTNAFYGRRTNLVMF